MSATARPSVWAVLAVLTFVAVAAGETVYLRDGRTLVGKVTRQKGKVRIEMSYGTVVVNESDVTYIGQGQPETQPAVSAAVDDYRPAAAQVRPVVQWDQSQATLPEPILFMTARRVELLPETLTHGGQQELQQWRAAVHDRQRKISGQWVARDQQDRRRAAFQEKLQQANEKARQAARLYDRTPADKARKRRLEAEAQEELLAAAQLWPDTVIRLFFLATLDLRSKEYAQAEGRFRWCVEAEPLVAAFRQGRGLALVGLKQHLQALEEFILCLKLRDDTYQTLKLLEDAMKETPGSLIKHPTYGQAKELLDRYEKPKYPYRSYGRDISWLMPGKPWTTRDDTLFAPPYDRIVAKQALAVPVSENGVLLVDSNAISGAYLMYVEVAPDQFARADTPRYVSYSARARDQDVPVTAIAVRGVTFTPVDVEKPAPLKAQQKLTIRAANVYRQMGTEIRTGETTVVSVDGDTVQLESALLPGEAVGAAFADGRFAGFLTARDKPEAEGCGQSVFVKPADVTAWMARMKRYLTGPPSYRSSTAPVLKEDARKLTATGNVFLVHILHGEKPPPKLVK